MKSLDDLKKLRDEQKFELGIREEIDHHNYVHIRVGMSTNCIQVGARETMISILNGVEKARIENVAVYPIAFENSPEDAPVVTVSMPDKDNVVYKQVTPEKATEIVEKHIIGGNIVSDYLA